MKTLPIKQLILSIFITIVIGAGIFSVHANSSRTEKTNFQPNPISPLVNFDDYEELVKEVKAHRKDRLIFLEDFLEMSKQENVVILDTRSDEMYKSKHIKGAVHLNFSDFNQLSLAQVIPSKDTKILIYCNNNFSDDPRNFTSKISFPFDPVRENSRTLALNIPTYINLYGYGYKNVYELSELVSVSDPRVEFDGSSIE